MNEIKLDVTFLRASTNSFVHRVGAFELGDRKSDRWLREVEEEMFASGFLPVVRKSTRKVV